MEDIKPATAISPATQGKSAPVTPVEATATSVPDKIMPLARQVQISGTIAQLPDAAGTILLNTVVGEISFELQQTAALAQQKIIEQLLNIFQTQRPVTAIIEPGDPPTQALLLLPQIRQALTNASDAAAPAGNVFVSFNPLQPSPSLAVNATLPAIVLPTGASGGGPVAATAPSPALPNAANLAAAAQDETSAQPLANALPVPSGQTKPEIPSLPGLIVANEIERLAGTPQPASQVRAPPQGAGYMADTMMPPTISQAPVDPGTVQTPLAALLQPGKEVALRIDTITSASSPPPVPDADNQIVATVKGRTPGGQLILQAGDTTLYVRQSVDAPPGTGLLLTVAAAKPDFVPLPLPDQQNLSSWQMIFNALSQIDPALAQQFVAMNMPQPSRNFTGGMLLFFSLLNRGGPQQWIGEDTGQALTAAGRSDLIARFLQDNATDGQIARDNVVGAWRAYHLPVFADAQMHNLRFYVHNDERETSSQQPTARSETRQIRFLIDVRMTRLGPLQIDGLVKPKKLDMILRSEKTLPHGLPGELRASYIATLEALGYTGGLSFQTGRQNWLVMQKQRANRDA